MMKGKKSKPILPKSNNPIAQALKLKIFQGKKVRPKKGKGSYDRNTAKG